VLPVSDIDLPVALAAAGAEDFDAAGFELEPLLQAAASRVSGTRAAAVHIKRNLLATRNYSFTMHADACATRLARGACDEVRARARFLPPGGRNYGPLAREGLV
jgi:hypothetical protein